MIQLLNDLNDANESMVLYAGGKSAVFIMVDDNTEEHCLPVLLSSVSILQGAEVIEVEAGEQSKSIEVCGHLWAHLLECNADRNSLIVNLGGGVVTDLGGFVAATYKRGISYINIPTSLMAMVDAAIGGKTAIDHHGVKNSVGVFHPPLCTYIYPEWLQTLNDTELKSGFAEMLKHAAIADENQWKNLIDLDSISAAAIAPFIISSAQIKMEVVKKDPAELGVRKLLNYGHSIGHALEAFYMQQGRSLTHGHCVALGMMVEALLGEQLGITDSRSAEEICAAVVRHFQIPAADMPDFASIRGYMMNDKKNRNGEWMFALPSKVGAARFDVSASEAQTESAYRLMKERMISA